MAGPAGFASGHLFHVASAFEPVIRRKQVGMTIVAAVQGGVDVVTEQCIPFIDLETDVAGRVATGAILFNREGSGAGAGFV